MLRGGNTVTKAELEILKRNRDEIIRLKKDLRALRARSPVQAQKITGMPSGGSAGDPVSVRACSDVDTEKRIKALCDESTIICQMIDPERTKEVFRLFYAKAMTWQQIADELGYSYRTGPQTTRDRYLEQKKLK